MALPRKSSHERAADQIMLTEVFTVVQGLEGAAGQVQ